MAAFGLIMRKLAWLGLVAAAILAPSGSEASSAGIRLFPDRVDIGTFFQGMDITLEGEVPAGVEAVVEIRGASAEETLLRKGRRGGLWMAVGEIKVENAPNLYLMLSSALKAPKLAGGQPPWGLSSLKSQVKISGALTEQEKDRFFQEFLELKKSEELYSTLPGTLIISNSSGDGAILKGTFRLPAKVAPGNYQVRLSVVKAGQVVDQKLEKLEVRMVGFPALMASLAYEHGAWYGILAVIIAIATGFIMGVLFKGGGEH